MELTSTMPEILVVDDDRRICELIADVAEELGLRASFVSDFTMFESKFQDGVYAAILLDLIMPDKDGIEYLRLLAERNCTARVVMMSGYDRRVLQTARRYGESQKLNMGGVLEKPFDGDSLADFLRSVCEATPRISVDAIEKAVARDEFFIEYQPKVDIRARPPADEERLMIQVASGSWPLDSFEALIRWNHPALGRVTPDHFIPLAETGDLIVSVTEYVNRTVIAQVREWLDTGHRVKVALNWPARMLTDILAPDRLDSQVREAGLECSQFVIEITETAAMSDPVKAMDILSRIRLKGFHLAMDDFGTGFSSMVQLNRMPFSEIKMDQSIIAELGTADEVGIMVRAIVDLGHNLGLSVCAEGVETRAALDFLQQTGCDTAQGFHMSSALRPEDIRLRTG